jgi:hypothetical protein
MSATLDQPAQRETALERLRRRETEIGDRLAASPAAREEVARELREAMSSWARRAKAAVGAEHPSAVADRKYVALEIEERALRAELEPIVEQRVEEERAEQAKAAERFAQEAEQLRATVLEGWQETADAFVEFARAFLEKVIPAERELEAHRIGPKPGDRSLAASPIRPFPVTLIALCDRFLMTAYSESWRGSSVLDDEQRLADLLPHFPEKFPTTGYERFIFQGTDSLIESRGPDSAPREGA